MVTYEYGSPQADNVLIQMVDDHDMEFLENEIAAIRRFTSVDFRLIAVRVRDWNADLSPWPAPPAFGKEPFAGRAGETLEFVRGLCAETGKNYYIGGYSLAGLFALWAAYRTDLFRGVAAASPSVWFPGFADFAKTRNIQSPAVYLSLGDKEEKTRNPVMAAVGDNIRGLAALLKEQGTGCILEWNQGNHFKEPDLRTAKAFAWVLNQ